VASTLKGAGGDEIEPAEFRRRKFGLSYSLVGQFDIGLSLPSTLGVPFALTVAQNKQPGYRLRVVLPFRHSRQGSRLDTLTTWQGFDSSPRHEKSPARPVKRSPGARSTKYCRRRPNGLALILSRLCRLVEFG